MIRGRSTERGGGEPEANSGGATCVPAGTRWRALEFTDTRPLRAAMSLRIHAATSATMSVAHVIATTSNGRRSNQSVDSQSFTTSVRRHACVVGIVRNGNRSSSYRRLFEHDTLIVHRKNRRLGGPLPGRLTRDSWRQAHCQRCLGVRAGGRAEETNRPVGADHKIDVHMNNTKFSCRFLATQSILPLAP